MAQIYLGPSPANVMFRRKLLSILNGQGLTGLVFNTSGLIISTIQNDEATATPYTVGAGNIETISTLGTYAAPTSGKCRFKEVDATNHPGLYEFQFADARFAGADKVVVSVLGAANLLEADFEVDVSLKMQENQPRVNFDVVAGVLTVRDQSGNALYTKNVTSDPAAEPITEIG